MRCPGLDLRYWKIDDIYEINCPICGRQNEIWKDDMFVVCAKCRTKIKNPRLNLSCADWCDAAEDCPGVKFKKENNSQE